MEFLETIANWAGVERLGSMLWNLFAIGTLSWLIVELLRRVDGDFPDWKNFRLVHKERPFFKKELGPELGIALFNSIITAPLVALLAFVAVEGLLQPNFGHQMFAPTIESWPVWVQVVIGLAVMDFALYIRHRFVHHFFWSYHTIHHSTREITWITWLKLHPLDMVVMGLIDVAVMYFIGFGGDAIAYASMIKFHFNRFCHSNIALDYPGVLRYIFVSPNMHRWHHAADDPKAVNTNFCIVFAWIDLLFGTYYVPKGQLPAHYGVWDENGKDVVGTGFWEMMAYPFVQHWKGIQRALGRTPATDPDQPAGPAVSSEPVARPDPAE